MEITGRSLTPAAQRMYEQNLNRESGSGLDLAVGADLLERGGR
jgi:hypothetical protein